MLPVDVTQLFLSNVGFIVLLQGDDDKRSLPIFIGAAEAQSIAIFNNKVSMPRPLTHDLFKDTLDFLECRLRRVEIYKVENGVFYAHLLLDRDGVLMAMDCRPSDAIALALRSAAPIYVAMSVMDSAGRILADEDEDSSSRKEEAPELQKRKNPPSHQKSPMESLKADLTRAVKAERYEDAARLRDEIQRLDNTHTEN